MASQPPADDAALTLHQRLDALEQRLAEVEAQRADERADDEEKDGDASREPIWRHVALACLCTFTLVVLVQWYRCSLASRGLQREQAAVDLTPDTTPPFRFRPIRPGTVTALHEEGLTVAGCAPCMTHGLACVWDGTTRRTTCER
jgi:hypothetical protein